MEEGEVFQYGNDVEGDQAGRDIYKTTINNNIPPQKRILAIANLLKKFAERTEQDTQLQSFIEDLDYYNRPMETPVIGLEQKLKDGSRENVIAYAMRAKESFHKKLFRNQFSEAAQNINLQILSWIEAQFFNHVYQKICNGHPHDEISSLIQEFIIDPLLNELENDTLGYTTLDINGMLYFLTGNCHIKWTK